MFCSFIALKKFSKIKFYQKYFIEISWQKQRFSTIFAAQKS